MRYEYTSNLADFKAAQRTYVRSSLRRRIVFFACMWGTLVMMLLAVLPFALQWDWRETPPALYGVLIAGILIPLSRPWQLKRTYKALNGDPNVPLSIYLAFEENMLISGIEGKNEARFQRSGVCNTIEDKDMLLLFVAKNRFLYLPKASLPEGALAAVYRWLELPGAPEKC